MKTSILIPDGESTLTQHVVHCLSMDGQTDIHILSKDPNASIKHSRWIKSFHHYDFTFISNHPDSEIKTGDAVVDELIHFHHYDVEKSKEIVEEIVRVAKATEAQIVFPVDEHIVKILAGQREKFTQVNILTLFSSPEMFAIAINKWQLSQFLLGKDVAHPATVRYQPGTSESVVRALSFPVIIKPIDQGNALGIKSFTAFEPLWNFLSAGALKHEYIIQPLIPGYDIDCSVLCLNGEILAYTIQKGIVWAKSTYHAAVGIEFLHDERVLAVMTRLMKLLNWSGVAHCDLRYDQDADEIKVIEINARYWGSLLGSLNAGINFPALACKTVKGETFQKPEFKHIRYFMGKSPMKKIVTSLFAGNDARVRLRDTSLYYTLRDPKPALIEIMNRLKRKF